LLAATVLVGLSTTALALLGSSVVLMTREHSNLNQVLTGMLMILTGLVIPLAELPLGLRLIGNALPVTHGFAGLREAFYGGNLTEIAPDLALEAVIAGALTASGFIIFRYVEAKGRQRGILEGAG
jgi:ABC-type polysaccharide/polyol phosphate export permease